VNAINKADADAAAAEVVADAAAGDPDDLPF